VVGDRERAVTVVRWESCCLLKDGNGVAKVEWRQPFVVSSEEEARRGIDR
jgi:hypothetical protein